jgi:type IV secretion system protein VirB6
MPVLPSLIDALDSGGDKAADDPKDRDKWFTGIGVAGPGVIAGSMLLLNKIALALFIGFGPLFILFLLFQQTRSLFSKWLFYGIGTLFSLAVLSVMVSLAMKMIGAVTAAFVAKYLLSMAPGMGSTDGINSMALQQGGLGLVLSTLIVMAPHGRSLLPGHAGPVQLLQPVRQSRLAQSRSPTGAGAGAERAASWCKQSPFTSSPSLDQPSV